MTAESLQALAAFIQAQRSANMGTVSTVIEILKLLPPGPQREGAIDKLTELINRVEAVNIASAPLYDALLLEAKNATRP